MNFDSGKLKIRVRDVSLPRSVFRMVLRKARGLFRRHPDLLGLQLDLQGDTLGSSRSSYVSRVRLVLPGYDPIVEKRSESLLTSIAQSLEVSGRQLRRRSRLEKSKLRNLAVSHA